MKDLYTIRTETSECCRLWLKVTAIKCNTGFEKIYQRQMENRSKIEPEAQIHGRD